MFQTIASENEYVPMAIDGKHQQRRNVIAILPMRT